MKVLQSLTSLVVSAVVGMVCIGCIPTTPASAETETRMTIKNVTASSYSYQYATVDDDVSEYSQVVKENLLAHTEKFTVAVDMDISGKSYSEPDLAQEIFVDAFTHTGVDNEGDYLSGSYEEYSMSMRYDNHDVLQVTYEVKYRDTLEQEAELDEYLDKVIAYLDLDGDTDYEKIFKIYDYVSRTTTYDYAGLDDDTNILEHTAYSALCKHTSVCDGYAQAIYRLCLRVGIDARIITGKLSGGGHAWNIVQLDGTYYLLDATNDSEKAKYSYFLKNYNSSSFSGYRTDSQFSTSEFLEEYPISSTEYSSGDTVSATRSTYGDYVYSSSIDSINILSYDGNDSNVVLPSKIDGLPVRRVSQSTFYNNDSIQTIVFPEGVEELSSMAIIDCENLESITIPSTMRIVQRASRKYVTGMNSVVRYCPNLKEYVLADGNPYLKLVDGVLYNADLTRLLSCPAKLVLSEVNIPSSVVYVGDYAFADNESIKRVTFPEGVTYIGYSSFQDAEHLAEVNIPESCTIVGYYAFQGTAIKELSIPAEFEGMILGGAFDVDTLESVEVSPTNGVYSVVDNCLLYTNPRTKKCTMLMYVSQEDQKSVTIPDEVVDIDERAFSENINIGELVLGSGITSCGTYSCWGATINRVVIPDTVTSISFDAFKGGDYSRKSSTYLELDIPATVTSIANDAIYHANSSKVIVHGDTGSTAETFAKKNGYTFLSNALKTTEVQTKVRPNVTVDISSICNAEDYTWVVVNNDSNLEFSIEGNYVTVASESGAGSTVPATLVGYNSTESVRIKMYVVTEDSDKDSETVTETTPQETTEPTVTTSPSEPDTTTTTTTTTTTDPDDSSSSSNELDILRLKKYILGVVQTTNTNYDLNSDGSIDVLDYMLFKNILIQIYG